MKLTKDKLIRLFKENGTDEPQCAIFMTKDFEGNVLFWNGWEGGFRSIDHRSLLFEFCTQDNSDDFDYHDIFENFSILEIRPDSMEIYGDIENDYYLFDYVINEFFSEYSLIQYNE